MSDMTDHLFISAGMHYYVGGRYAVFAGLNPTAANLLHHAVEMALKGALAKKGMDLKALKSVRLQLHALAYNLANFLRTLATPHSGCCMAAGSRPYLGRDF